VSILGIDRAVVEHGIIVRYPEAAKLDGVLRRASGELAALQWPTRSVGSYAVHAAQYSRTVESSSPKDKGFCSTRVAPAGARAETDE
jgi:hypothetical protein